MPAMVTKNKQATSSSQTLKPSVTNGGPPVASPVASPGGATAATPTPLVLSSKKIPTKVTKNKQATSSSPTLNPSVTNGGPPGASPGGASAAASTPLAQATKIMPAKVTKNKQATSSLPTPPVPAQKAPGPFTKAPSSQSVASKGPITPSVAQTAVTQVPSSPGSVAPSPSPIVSVTPSSPPSPTNPAASSAVPTSAPRITFSREENISLTEHNFYRAIHKSAPINLNKNLVLEARQFAQKLAAEGKLTHQSPHVLNKLGQGENLGMVCSKVKNSRRRAILKIVGTWYEEACLYNFEEPDLSSKATAHFTQLVWNGTNQLGIGVAESESAGKHCVFVVARYKPKGNIKDKEQFKINVKRGVFDPSIDCTITTEKRFRIG
ncbi:uncharacterized protein LOC144649636 [Oculina patagonica]